jgi:hypothetical protein
MKILNLIFCIFANNMVNKNWLLFLRLILTKVKIINDIYIYLNDIF